MLVFGKWGTKLLHKVSLRGIFVPSASYFQFINVVVYLKYVNVKNLFQQNMELSK